MHKRAKQNNKGVFTFFTQVVSICKRCKKNTTVCLTAVVQIRQWRLFGNRTRCLCARQRRATFYSVDNFSSQAHYLITFIVYYLPCFVKSLHDIVAKPLSHIILVKHAKRLLLFAKQNAVFARCNTCNFVIGDKNAP